MGELEVILKGKSLADYTNTQLRMALGAVLYTNTADMWDKYLKSLGYSGTVSAMLQKYYIDYNVPAQFRNYINSGAIFGLVNPNALSIYNKLTAGGEWFVLDSAGSTITGAHNLKTATKIGTGATTVVAGGVDFTPDALYRVATADLPFTITNNSKISICGWVSADSLATVSPFLIGDSTVSTAANKALHGFFMSGGSLKGRAGTTGAVFDADSPASTVTTATTYFLQLRRLSDKVQIRINNGTWYETAITADSCPNGNQTISIGGDFSTTSPVNTHANQFNGVIGDVLIHGSNTETLTDAEFTYLYNNGIRKTYAQLKTAAGF